MLFQVVHPTPHKYGSLPYKRGVPFDMTSEETESSLTPLLGQSPSIGHVEDSHRPLSSPKFKAKGIGAASVRVCTLVRYDQLPT